MHSIFFKKCQNSTSRTSFGTGISMLESAFNSGTNSKRHAALRGRPPGWPSGLSLHDDVPLAESHTLLARGSSPLRLWPRANLGRGAASLISNKTIRIFRGGFGIIRCPPLRLYSKQRKPRKNFPRDQRTQKNMRRGARDLPPTIIKKRKKNPRRSIKTAEKVGPKKSETLRPPKQKLRQAH